MRHESGRPYRASLGFTVTYKRSVRLELNSAIDFFDLLHLQLRDANINFESELWGSNNSEPSGLTELILDKLPNIRPHCSSKTHRRFVTGGFTGACVSWQ